jgi:SAM-dependent methyltransferase
MTQATTPQQEIQQQAGKVMAQVAGYIGVRTIDIGLRRGILAEIGKHPDGIAHGELAKKLGMDAFYVEVWCQSAYAAEVIDLSADRKFSLAPHMDKLLLDNDFPGYIGGMPAVLLSKEMFGTFDENLESGDPLWWDKCSPEFIKGVQNTGRAFYNRLIPNGMSKIAGLEEKLNAGAHVLELATGAGFGLTKMATQYPKSTFVGLDGDAFSLGLAKEAITDAGASNRVSFVKSWFEDIDHDSEFDACVINISMHECRDIEKVTAKVHQALKPDGVFVISDFPFPETTEGTRTVPARIMCGIQFFEALIEDQLLPTQAYVDLLGKQGFRNVESFDITPAHAVTHGVK